MLTEYVEEALKRARYELIDDEEPYYGEVAELKGVWATSKTLEECRNNLKEVIEGWIILSIKKELPIPTESSQTNDKHRFIDKDTQTGWGNKSGMDRGRRLKPPPLKLK